MLMIGLCSCTRHKISCFRLNGNKRRGENATPKKCDHVNLLQMLYRNTILLPPLCLNREALWRLAARKRVEYEDVDTKALRSEYIDFCQRWFYLLIWYIAFKLALYAWTKFKIGIISSLKNSVVGI